MHFFADYHEVHNNTASGRLRAGGQPRQSSLTDTPSVNRRDGGSFTSMVCEHDGNGDCNEYGHWYTVPDLDGSLIMTMILSTWSIRQHAGAGQLLWSRNLFSDWLIIMSMDPAITISWQVEQPILTVKCGIKTLLTDCSMNFLTIGVPVI